MRRSFAILAGVLALTFALQIAHAAEEEAVGGAGADGAAEDEPHTFPGLEDLNRKRQRFGLDPLVLKKGDSGNYKKIKAAQMEVQQYFRKTWRKPSEHVDTHGHLYKTHDEIHQELHNEL
mmetsp:Transcript_18792/g.60350  ORF Transcript_18792/g.60350 Transcript_18792/m.60350 type:complete len:120 (+) Transcript_18792:124-483(+)|eukprot:CAMPEP_0182912118 /NCGR_PEP_ID=MMETSP0034_2-20130328/37345_1 /TAXON_ID=156128 /ORGANISM="Nephroselmis pyriformis, Strain CCMP717" /LENGTH=119 /DNA_ID=CAMNT_0025048771 /DNA_START=115 /DNA_END=474 /DNA_ORIENTATION=-